jgi:hypothetical protein
MARALSLGLAHDLVVDTAVCPHAQDAVNPAWASSSACRSS